MERRPSAQSPLEMVRGMARSRQFGVPYQRKPLSRAVKAHVWSMTFGKCWYCGVTLNPFSDFVVEHIMPLCRGGEDEIENLAPSCVMCNQDKGAKTLEEWRPFFADAEGLGRDSRDWLFWFERPKESPGWREGYKNHERIAWREVEIRGFRVQEDCDASGAC